MANGADFVITDSTQNCKVQQVAVHQGQNGYVEYFGVAQFAAIGDTSNELILPFSTVFDSSFTPLGGFAAGEGEIGIDELPVKGVISRDANKKITIKRGAGGTTQLIHFRIRGY